MGFDPYPNTRTKPRAPELEPVRARILRQGPQLQASPQTPQEGPKLDQMACQIGKWKHGPKPAVQFLVVEKLEHLNIALYIVGNPFSLVGSSHVSNGQHVSFKEPCQSDRYPERETHSWSPHDAKCPVD